MIKKTAKTKHFGNQERVKVLQRQRLRRLVHSTIVCYLTQQMISLYQQRKHLLTYFIIRIIQYLNEDNFALLIR